MKNNNYTSKITKIVHVVVTMDRGGIETLLMSLLRTMDSSQIQMDFIVHGGTIGVYEDEIKALGGRIHRVRAVRKPWDFFLWQKELYNIFKNEKYDGVHCHLEQESRLVLKQAKRANIPMRIAHSHSTSSQRRGLKKLICRGIELTAPWKATHFFGCSHLAGEWLFGKKITESHKFTFFKNGICTEKFRFDPIQRENTRAEFKIEKNDILLGHVGRMTPEKNHIFMIELLKKLPSQYKLIFVGDGHLRQNLEKIVQENFLEERVTFTGIRADTEKIYNAFDIFILPSLYEGLPVVGIEAQVNGLRCLLSNSITPEVQLSEHLTYLPLLLDDWVEKIQTSSLERKILPTPTLNTWDIHNIGLWLQNFYQKQGD